MMRQIRYRRSTESETWAAHVVSRVEMGAWEEQESVDERRRMLEEVAEADGNNSLLDSKMRIERYAAEMNHICEIDCRMSASSYAW